MYMTYQAKRTTRFEANKFTNMKIFKLTDFAGVSSRNGIPFFELLFQQEKAETFPGGHGLFMSEE